MKQFADSETWRKKHNVDALYATFPVDEFEGARRFYPRWTGRRDKVTRPRICPHPPLTLETLERLARVCLPNSLPRRASAERAERRPAGASLPAHVRRARASAPPHHRH